jgi:hypothetical protein
MMVGGGERGRVDKVAEMPMSVLSLSKPRAARCSLLLFSTIAKTASIARRLACAQSAPPFPLGYMNCTNWSPRLCACERTMDSEMTQQENALAAAARKCRNRSMFIRRTAQVQRKATRTKSAAQSIYTCPAVPRLFHTRGH